ncbi:MAG: HAD family hydrolase [Candidatus Omnitrophica bacterium]|nr:HAD family hydrolase [Candidatus Omnitrophota bacterium]
MQFDAVIFDIDNVLVDTRASYTDCIRKTVEAYLESILSFQPSRTVLLTRADIEHFKSLGGFNDDWDTCYGLLLYLLSLKIKRRTINDLRKVKNITSLLSSPRKWGRKKMGGKPITLLGVKGAQKIWSRKKEVLLSKIAHIFQRFYLGDFVWNEKLLISKVFLKQLKRAGLKIGIVTGRNREEAGFALRRFRIDSLIDALITADDTPKESKKPNPYGLVKIASKLGRNLRYLYVGDLPDDILAARNARKKLKINSCGFLAASTSPKDMKRAMKKAGADFVCDQAKELAQIIHSPNRHSL